MATSRPDFSLAIRDNEEAAAKALADGNFLYAFLLVHTLMETLLRVFLNDQRERVRFAELVEADRRFLADQRYVEPTFVDDLTKFNERRNRIMHQLWRRGFSYTNKQAEDAARAAVVVYGLFIEFLETFDLEITELGFKYYGGPQVEE